MPNLPRLLLRLLFGRRLPRYQGELTLAGIERPVLIRRDTFGVPYIEAENERDAWFALGFCQGQDRAFQLETLTRLARGTLAELVGPSGLPADRLARRLGFRRLAEAQLTNGDPDTVGRLEAFAAGVNAGRLQGLPAPAHEFALLRARPCTFEAADVLAIQMYLALALSPWAAKLTRLKVLVQDGAEAVRALFSPYADWLPVAVPPGAPAGEALDRLADDLARLTGWLSQAPASNNWALAPSRTATGRPILANDPHLLPGLPAPWYLAQVRTPEWSLGGACFVGAPGFPVGHNDHLAWGVTAGVADTIDLFIEDLGPDGRTARGPEGPEPVQVLREVIRVRGRGEVVEEATLTRRGPLLGDLLEEPRLAVSLRAPWAKPRAGLGFLALSRARTAEDLRQAFQDWPFAALNVVFAETSGRIGYQLVGAVPAREGPWSLVALPAWDPAARPGAPLPLGRLPQALDPPEGFVATANTLPAPHGSRPYLGEDWIDGYRLARIVEALQAREDWDPAAVRALQLDVVSLPWREMREAVLAAPSAGEAAQAQALLREWDGVLAPDSPAASVFALFYVALARLLLRARAPRTAAWAFSRPFDPLVFRPAFAARMMSLVSRLVREQPDGWLDRPWPKAIAEALAEAIRGLRARHGPDPRRWAWGRVRPLTLEHPFGARRWLRPAFNLGPFPVGGDSNTVAQAGVDLFEPTRNVAALANLRAVMDVGAWDECTFVLAGGQSGNPLSPHYGDQVALWRRGEGVPLRWSPEAIRAAAVHTLRLEPAG